VKLDTYVKRELFAPLCIPERFWYTDEAGNPHAMAGVELTPMEFARLGQLMLDNGVWQGTRLLSAQWMKEALMPSERFPRVGLLWWLDVAHGSYRAEGLLGQHLVVVPGERLVAVRMKRQSDDHRPEHNFMTSRRR
jgi:CubicO group peptidase (beta-lactamase class C family)